MAPSLGSRVAGALLIEVGLVLIFLYWILHVRTGCTPSWCGSVLLVGVFIGSLLAIVGLSILGSRYADRDALGYHAPLSRSEAVILILVLATVLGFSAMVIAFP